MGHPLLSSVERGYRGEYRAGFHARSRGGAT
jgi:hypothetical protein